VLRGKNKVLFGGMILFCTFAPSKREKECFEKE
jgi:hypothetical protein